MTLSLPERASKILNGANKRSARKIERLEDKIARENEALEAKIRVLKVKHAIKLVATNVELGSYRGENNPTLLVLDRHSEIVPCPDTYEWWRPIEDVVGAPVALVKHCQELGLKLRVERRRNSCDEIWEIVAVIS